MLLTLLALTHVTVIDPSGNARPNMTVLIRGERIVAVQSEPPTKDAQIVDARGKFLIPGLWDMHVHLSWTTAVALPVLLANGVTGVRDMGGRLGELDDWRARIAAGLLAGPRIIRAGPTLNGQKFNFHQLVVGTPEETRGVVRALKEAGVDFLKTHRRTPRESYFALIEEAKHQGLAVAGHIPMTVSPEEASDAGQACFEHTETLFEGAFAAKVKGQSMSAAIRSFRENGASELFARLVKNGTVVDPTVVSYRAIVQSFGPACPPDPRDKYVAESARKQAAERYKPAPPEELAEWKRMYAELLEVVRQMNRSGVTLVTGTDLALPPIYPGFSLHNELVLLVECGLSPQQALQAATLNSVRVLKREKDFGTVEAGKIADMVLLDANPLDDIRNTQRIWAVVFGGRLIRRVGLDRLLKEGEQPSTRN